MISRLSKVVNPKGKEKEKKEKKEQKPNRDHLNGELLSRGEVRASRVIFPVRELGERVLDDKDFNAYSLTAYTFRLLYLPYLKVRRS